MDRWVDRYIDSFTIFVLDICAEIELGIFLLPFSEGGGGRVMGIPEGS
jgi:hypothetical protein